MLLLKGIAVVATVPRPEDVGIDAVATLLREGPNDSLIAENSFYVQFKSSSERIVKYREHEVRWLESLKLPFFIGSIDKAACQINLFACHRLSQVLIENAYENVELLLDMTNKAYLGMDTATESISDSLRRVNIGPPLLRWSTNDLSHPQFPSSAYTVLKPYLEAEQRNLEFRAIRFIEQITWETGKPPTCGKSQMHFFSMLPNDELVHIFNSMLPSLIVILARCQQTHDRDTFTAALMLVRYMRQNGFDPDPHHMFDLIHDKWDQLTPPTA